MKQAHRTGHELRAAILDELEWTPSVDADHVGVAVGEDGAIIVSGEVSTYPEREEAIRAAQRVAGVTAVADEIIVRHAWSAPSDADLARDVSDAINRTVTVPPESVKASVHNHVVTLSGRVRWEFQRVAAQRAVGEIPGVRWVKNEVVIQPATVLAPGEAEVLIAAALARNSLLDPQHIHVHIRGSKVSLTGHVRSLAERRRAEEIVWCTPGVTELHNHLTVRPGTI
jgi:osmotically-inducible protein OsmY